jgi:hypothetical protein
VPNGGDYNDWEKQTAPVEAGLQVADNISDQYLAMLGPPK